MPFSVKQIEVQIIKYENQKDKIVNSAETKLNKLKAQIEEIENEKKSSIEPLEMKIKQLYALKKKAEQIENDFTATINNL